MRTYTGESKQYINIILLATPIKVREMSELSPTSANIVRIV